MIYKPIIIAKNTFVEIIRQPVYSVLLTCAVLCYIIGPSISMYTMDEDIKLLRELGLSTLFIVGLFIAVFSASAAISEEIETKTVTTVLTKPVSRSIFVIGKFLGISSAVIVAHYICTVAMLFSIRHGVLTTASDTHDWTVITAAVVVIMSSILLSAFFNYSYDWNFIASAVCIATILSTIALSLLCFIDKQWQFNPSENHFNMFDVNASVLLLMAVLILVAISVMFSTRFNLILTLIFCIGIFLLGLISDYVFGRFADTHLWAKIGQILTPNFQVFWVSDAIMTGTDSIPAAYLGMSAVYSGLYTVAILLFAIAFFQKRQLG